MLPFQYSVFKFKHMHRALKKITVAQCFIMTYKIFTVIMDLVTLCL
jgi:hypothetical protein